MSDLFAEVRCEIIKRMADPAAMTNHARGLDETSRGCTVRKGPRVFAWSNVTDKFRQVPVGDDSPATDLVAAYRKHKENHQAGEGAKSSFALHLIAVASPEWLDEDPKLTDKRRRALIVEATKWANKALGPGTVFAARYDVNEAALWHGVDLEPETKRRGGGQLETPEIERQGRPSSFGMTGLVGHSLGAREALCGTLAAAHAGSMGQPGKTPEIGPESAGFRPSGAKPTACAPIQGVFRRWVVDGLGRTVGGRGVVPEGLHEGDGPFSRVGDVLPLTLDVLLQRDGSKPAVVQPNRRLPWCDTFLHSK